MAFWEKNLRPTEPNHQQSENDGLQGQRVCQVMGVLLMALQKVKEKSQHITDVWDIQVLHSEVFFGQMTSHA